MSVYKNALEMDLAAMHFKEISLITTRCNTKEGFQTAINLLASGKTRSRQIIERIPAGRWGMARKITHERMNFFIS
ncbi:hypothetical protein [Priestia megaterium]|uniref:hypothetical protein n=1 Tax=Priestia megaterium TaxID=1404 RepID=UPI001F0F8A7F|nr:hypothetical protein [Priestia megaterium]